jgi:hypothetical protein
LGQLCQRELLTFPERKSSELGLPNGSNKAANLPSATKFQPKNSLSVFAVSLSCKNELHHWYHRRQRRVFNGAYYYLKKPWLYSFLLEWFLAKIQLFRASQRSNVLRNGHLHELITAEFIDSRTLGCNDPVTHHTTTVIFDLDKKQDYFAYMSFASYQRREQQFWDPTHFLSKDSPSFRANRVRRP